MNEIICPHCNKAFKVDETGYSNILKQVRDSEFDRDVKDRLDQYEKEKSSALALAAKDSDNKMFSGLYPNNNWPVHHDNFDHELLRDLLHNHKGGFILSYNNCETIREYYKDFDLHYPEWHYSYQAGEKRVGKNKIERGVEHSKKDSHEILICKKI